MSPGEHSHTGEAPNLHGTTNANSHIKRKRGRPKGASSATLAEVRAQANKEKKRIREELQTKILLLKQEINETEVKYQRQIDELKSALQVTRKREESYREALDIKLEQVAEHLHETLLNWAQAELEEGAVYKRKRGRPRKTLR